MSSSMPQDNRRAFLRNAALAVAGTTAPSQTTRAAESPTSHQPLIQPGDTVLFQGDSITDAGRKRETAAEPNNQSALGGGYAFMAAANLLTAQPDLKVFNRGISGHKVFQLAERWQADCLDIKPNVLSILIGVNDIWHKRNGKYDGTVEIYERDFKALVVRTREALPEVKLVICEPFVLKCGAIDDSWFPEFDNYRAAAKRVAEEAKAVFVPFHSLFEAAVKLAPPEHWAKDGVHPSNYGAALMAHAWVQAVS
jgi:lysophospholipase L1-like esterase